jgi:hypothetical protein
MDEAVKKSTLYIFITKYSVLLQILNTALLLRAGTYSLESQSGRLVALKKGCKNQGGGIRTP